MVRHFIALLLVAGLGVLFLGLWAGYQPDATLNLTARYYADHTAQDIGAANIVTAIVVTYRGLDTLGEVTVLFLAATIVGLVLARGRRGDHGARGEKATETQPSGEMLATGSRLLAPLIMLLGVYVFANGHLTPGGGFQGGAIMASGVLLLLLADPRRALAHTVISGIESLSGLAYVAIGLMGAAFAGGFLDNRFLPIGSLGEMLSAGAIPVIYTLIGLKVGAEFASMLASLSETEAL